MRPLPLVLLLSVCLGSILFLYRTVEPADSYPRVAEFAGVSLTLEYATTSEERERGLGGRRSLPADHGMLFVFPKPDYYGFWMKDTIVPLDIFWINAQGQVVYVAADVATSTYPDVFYPSSPSVYVLETASGFARTHAVAAGTVLHLKNLPTVSE